MITICGKEYKDITSCAKQHHIKPGTLYYRLRKYGYNNPAVLGPNKREVTILGKTYPSLAVCARQHGLRVGVLQKRIDRYGADCPLLFCKVHITNPIKVRGKWYPNKEAVAKAYHLSPSALRKRRLMYGDDWDLILQPSLGEHNHSADLYRQWVNKHGFLTPTDVAKKLNLPINFIQHVLSHYFAGYTAVLPHLDQYLVDTSKLGFPQASPRAILSKYLFKPAVIDAFRENYRRIGEQGLVVIPFTGAKYFYDASKHEVWSNIRSPYVYRKCNSSFKYGQRTFSITFADANRSATVRDTDIIDLIKYPKLSYDDIVSFPQIKASLGIKGQLAERSIAGLPRHRRFKQRQAKYGITKQDAKKVVTYYQQQAKDREAHVNEVNIMGNYYSSWAEAARYFNMSPGMLRWRAKKYGTQDPRILESNPLRPVVEVNYRGHHFGSIAEACAYYGISPATAHNRRKKYGDDWSKVFCQSRLSPAGK